MKPSSGLIQLPLLSVLLATCLDARKTPVLPLPTSITHNWGAYTPYFAVPNYSVPHGCEVNQLNLLHRHGARFPTAKNGAKLNTTVSEFVNATSFPNPKMAFLGNFTYALGADDLLPYGAAEAFDSGVLLFGRYDHLLSHTESGTPFFRSTSEQRVIDTAGNFTLGLLSAAGRHVDFFIPPLEVISEAGNDTLNDGNCPDAGGSGKEQEKWVDVYTPPIQARLNAGVIGVTLSGDDVQNLMEMCAFPTIILDGKGVSPFCDLFEDEDWIGFEYSSDVDKFYDTGYGQKLGPVQGVGWTNELLARLTDQPVNDSTNHNASLPFPLGRNFYADFSHDDEMIAIYSAIGLFQQPADLPETNMPNKTDTWIASRLVPFASRMMVERLTCEHEEGQFVRIIVNEQTQPLEFCEGANEKGLCSLDNFVASQSFETSGGDGKWQKCFA